MTIEYRDETPFTGDDHTPTELANAIRTKKYGKDVNLLHNLLVSCRTQF